MFTEAKKRRNNTGWTSFTECLNIIEFPQKMMQEWWQQKQSSGKQD